jgi:hypothetical protein
VGLRREHEVAGHARNEQVPGEDLLANLMMPFGRLADDAGREIVLGPGDIGAILHYCREMGVRQGCPDYIRFFFGFAIDAAIRAGFGITQRGLREATPHACAEETARRSLELARRVGGHQAMEEPRVLDLFAGSGQVAFSFAKARCQVDAVDNDDTIGRVGTQNLALAGLADAVELTIADAPTVLAAAVDKADRYTVVHLDPPWSGTYDYDLNHPFYLNDLSVDVRRLIADGLEAAPLVVLDLPHNLVPDELRGLAKALECEVLVQYQYVSDFPACFGLAPAFFSGSTASRSSRSRYREEHQPLTIDGMRIMAGTEVIP